MNTNIERSIAQRAEALNDTQKMVISIAEALYKALPVRAVTARGDIHAEGPSFDGLVRLMQLIENAGEDIAKCRKEMDWYRAALIALIEQRDALANAAAVMPKRNGNDERGEGPDRYPAF